MTSWEENKTFGVQGGTVTASTQCDTLLGKACAICHGFIQLQDPNIICERCRRKLKAFVEAEE